MPLTLSCIILDSEVLTVWAMLIGSATLRNALHNKELGTMVDFKGPLHAEHFSLIQTQRSHFEPLYQIAGDPLIWEQHPDKDRWRREVFSVFFENGLNNDLGCFTIIDGHSERIIGSTRFYAHDAAQKSIRLGYTFIAREYWGTDANKVIKTALLNHIFQHVETVFFDIGDANFRSIRATEKLGATFWQHAGDGKSVYRLLKLQFFSKGSP